jgi:hypothetical protein
MQLNSSNDAFEKSSLIFKLEILMYDPQKKVCGNDSSLEIFKCYVPKRHSTEDNPPCEIDRAVFTVSDRKKRTK